MLIGPLEVQVDRHAHVRPLLAHRGEGARRVEPHVEDVGLLAQRGLRRTRALQALRSEALQGRRYQTPAPSFSTASATLSISSGLDDRLAAVLAERDRDGHAPRALAADAPVRPVLQHAADALAAPPGHPCTLVDLRQRPAPERRVQAAVASSGRSSAMNHWWVARKMTGLWQRQQCG